MAFGDGAGEKGGDGLYPRVLIGAISLTWLTLAIASCTVYLVADDWGCLERIMDHGAWWSFNPAVPGRVFYRPLTQDLYYRVMSEVFGHQHVAYHVVNMLLHVGNIILVIRIGRRLTERNLAALWAGLLFAANPGSFLIVNFITGIQEIVMMNLCLLAVLCFLKLDEERDATRRSCLIGGPALYALSLFAKETALWVPVWLWIHDLLKGLSSGRPVRSVVRSRVAAHLPYDFMLVFYLGMRLIFMPPPREGLYTFSIFGTHVFARLEDSLRVAAKSLGLPGLESASDYFIYTIVAATILTVLVIWFIGKRRVWSPVILGFAWLGIGVSIFLPLTGRFYEYYVSFALIGAAWAAGYGLDLGIDKLSSVKRALGRAAFIFCLALVVLSSGINYYIERRDNFVVNLARSTLTIHRGMKSLHPDFPRGARIIMFTDFRVHGDPTHFGIRALYNRPDLRVILDEQAYRIERKGNDILLIPRPDFDYTGVYGFAYTKCKDPPEPAPCGFMPVRIGVDGSVPFTAQVPSGS
jgi:hypothetical protein